MRRQKDALSSGHPLVGRFEVDLCQQLNSEISTKLQSDQSHTEHTTIYNENNVIKLRSWVSFGSVKVWDQNIFVLNFLAKLDSSKKNCLEILILKNHIIQSRQSQREYNFVKWEELKTIIKQ